MSTPEYGYVITLGTKEYPGPLFRRRVPDTPALPEDTIVYEEDEVYEVGVYV